MKRFNWLVALFWLQSLVTFCSSDLNSDIRLAEWETKPVLRSRKKRYVVFPEGSTLTLAICVSPAAVTGTGTIFTNSIAWAISYDLPNETIHTSHKNHLPSKIIHRQKRDLYVRLEKLIDSSGLEGKKCVLKTICETSQQLNPRQGMLEEIFRLIFTYASQEESYLDGNANDPYVMASRVGEINQNCDALFPCPVSFLQMGLEFGKYS